MPSEFGSLEQICPRSGLLGVLFSDYPLHLQRISFLEVSHCQVLASSATNRHILIGSIPDNDSSYGPQCCTQCSITPLFLRTTDAYNTNAIKCRFDNCKNPGPTLTPSTLPPNAIQFYSRRNLRPSPLSPNRQTHRMSPPPIRPHILQSRYVLHQFSP